MTGNWRLSRTGLCLRTTQHSLGKWLNRFSRETCRSSIKAGLFVTLADLSRERGDIPGAIHWIEAGREDAHQEDNPFEAVFRWDMKELALRLEDPTDEALSPLLQRLNGYYGPKLPRFAEYLGGVLRDYGIEDSSVLLTTTAGGASSQGSLWTPGQAAAGVSGTAGGGEKKLWLPGQ